MSPPRGGRDGNLIQLYSTSKTATLTLDQTSIQLLRRQFGRHMELQHRFHRARNRQLRQCWLTLRPRSPSALTGYRMGGRLLQLALTERPAP